MAVEIEHKFLVRDERWRSEVERSVRMRQGYLTSDARCSVQVRIAGDQGSFERQRAGRWASSAASTNISFRWRRRRNSRHLVRAAAAGKPSLRAFGGHLWEIDEFEGDNAGLIVAEVELSRIDEPFDRPDWLGADVSHDIRYYNSQLARHPYRTWSCPERLIRSASRAAADAAGSERRATMVYPVSTARNGPGERRGSGCTPRGWHHPVRVGAGLPLNTVFVGRRPTGGIYDSDLAVCHPERDWILTRILWLTGLESGQTVAANAIPLRRFIYIHGCPDTAPMGVPLSHNCIRMRGRDLLALFERVAAGDQVFIAG